MYNPELRILDGGEPPDEQKLKQWMGAAGYRRWAEMIRYIDQTYPGVFEPDWLFPGKKYGWGLRFRKSKSFCWLIPEHGRPSLLVILGKDERSKVEAILEELHEWIRQDYAQAKVYADGKGLVIPLENDELVSDMKRLLTIKRAPKKAVKAARVS